MLTKKRILKNASLFYSCTWVGSAEKKKHTHTYFAKTTPPRGNARTILQVDELTKLSISRYL